MDKLDEILQEIKEIKLIIGSQKKMLSLKEFCAYLNISQAYAYHLTSSGKIKCYRPFGKMIYFDLEEVIEFLKQNPSGIKKDVSRIVSKHFLNSKLKGYI